MILQKNFREIFPNLCLDDVEVADRETSYEPQLAAD